VNSQAQLLVCGKTNQPAILRVEIVNGIPGSLRVKCQPVLLLGSLSMSPDRICSLNENDRLIFVDGFP
jgi:hypothetical protein